MADINKYIPMVDAILSVSNPDEISPKRVRKALQILYSVNLDSQRKLINELILERFGDIQENPRVLIPKNDLISRDQELSLRLQKEEERPLRSTRKKKGKSESKSKRKKKKNDSPDSNRISVRKVLLSAPLQKFLGSEELPRTQVVKMIWQYIKEHDLQNPKDRREILCDEKMEPIFGKKMTMFSMNKLLTKHLFNPDEIVKHEEEQKQTPEKEIKLENESLPNLSG
ncbi:AIC_G0042740.mRNA.1.CDS.1 [Saccharomyces cerevisiae]|uniref:Tri1p n=1 Tax=Saccharomyces cerevisiae x Saccharomyces kudriavzevii (strain VIN7) TaxID=1095631 RepID=H0GLD6_SACCK|nr:Tri1p [Saccharomyces cerevisiae YJM270]AJS72152.1 Tri1p [Saccharomyces cerevisiae YJM693]EHN05465.1 Tri1p [Saccharomyces cerevisiae x Saccharomyces kudriavzevii VIN7]PTN19045.1 Tri1p [Saccharomyces cerevisiae]PTN24410.1 Tri1p [Saccharomyces cerevisiae]